MRSLKTKHILGLCLSFFIGQTSIASDLSIEEKNSMIKEEIASVQVMQEICPSIIGQNSKFDQNLQKLITDYLHDYSDKSMTYEQLKSDSEYTLALKDARESAKDSTKEDNKSACNEVITLEM